MPKTYESKASGHIISVAIPNGKDHTGKDVYRHMPPLVFKAPNKWALGVLVLDEPTLRASGFYVPKAGETSAEKVKSLAAAEKAAAAIVESTPDFEGRLPGTKAHSHSAGIWPKEERVAKDESAKLAGIKATFAEYSDEQLHARLKSINVTIPVNADHTALVDLLYNAFAGEITPETTTTGTPGGVTRGPQTT